MKKIIVAFLLVCVGIFVLCLMAGFLFSDVRPDTQTIIKDKDNNVNTDKMEAKKESKTEEKLKVTNLKLQNEKITGIIENTTNEEIDYIEVEVIYYNKENIITGKDMTNYTEFKPTEKWQFEIHTLNKKFKTYKVSVKNY